MILRIILCIFSCSVVAKPVHIQITGGQNTGIPIAVLPFTYYTKTGDKVTTKDGSLWKGVANISAVIRKDLQNSGQFTAKMPGKLQIIPENISQVNINYWRQKKIENIILGQVRELEDGFFDVKIQLVSLYRSTNKPLLHLKYEHQSSKRFRSLSHHISDRIFTKLMGVKGFFSTRIAYITVTVDKGKSLHNLTVADADGYNDHALVTSTQPLMSPKWSPDGGKIAFVSFHGMRASIKTVEVKTGEIKNISSFKGINGAPSWSPDGNKLAIVLSKDGNPKIYVMDLDGKRITKLTHGWGIDTEPVWHPNGNEIYFTSDRGGKPQVYKIATSGGKPERVTFKGRYNTTPSITPDGKQMVMLHQNDNGNYNIAVMNLKTGRLKKITSASLDESPTIAPNGMMVLYGFNEGYENILGAVTLDGRFRMRLPSTEGNVKEPAWSPFLL